MNYPYWRYARPKKVMKLELLALHVIIEALGESGNVAAILFLYAFPPLEHLTRLHYNCPRIHLYDRETRKLQITELSFCRGCYAPFSPDEIKIRIYSDEIKVAAKIINDFISCQVHPPRVLKLFVQNKTPIEIDVYIDGKRHESYFEPVFTPDIPGYDLVAWDDLRRRITSWTWEKWYEVTYWRAKRGGEQQPRSQSSSLSTVFQTTLAGYDFSERNLEFLTVQLLRVLLEAKNSLNSNYAIFDGTMRETICRGAPSFAFFEDTAHFPAANPSNYPSVIISPRAPPHLIQRRPEPPKLDNDANIRKGYFAPFAPDNITFRREGWLMGKLEADVNDFLSCYSPRTLSISLVAEIYPLPSVFPFQISGYELLGWEDLQLRPLIKWKDLRFNLYYRRRNSRVTSGGSVPQPQPEPWPQPRPGPRP